MKWISSSNSRRELATTSVPSSLFRRPRSGIAVHDFVRAIAAPRLAMQHHAHARREDQRRQEVLIQPAAADDVKLPVPGLHHAHRQDAQRLAIGKLHAIEKRAPGCFQSTAGSVTHSSLYPKRAGHCADEMMAAVVGHQFQKIQALGRGQALGGFDVARIIRIGTADIDGHLQRGWRAAMPRHAPDHFFAARIEHLLELADQCSRRGRCPCARTPGTLPVETTAGHQPDRHRDHQVNSASSRCERSWRGLQPDVGEVQRYPAGRRPAVPHLHSGATP